MKNIITGLRLMAVGIIIDFFIDLVFGAIINRKGEFDTADIIGVIMWVSSFVFIYVGLRIAARDEAYFLKASNVYLGTGIVDAIIYAYRQLPASHTAVGVDFVFLIFGAICYLFVLRGMINVCSGLSKDYRYITKTYVIIMVLSALSIGMFLWRDTLTVVADSEDMLVGIVVLVAVIYAAFKILTFIFYIRSVFKTIKMCKMEVVSV